MNTVSNDIFYITESLKTGEVKRYSCEEYFNRILKQYPTYDILTHFKDNKKIVNQKNKLVFDFDGKNLDDFQKLIDSLNSIPQNIEFCCSGYVKPQLSEEIKNINSKSKSNKLIYFDVKNNVEDIFSCHVIFNIAITTEEFINIKQDLITYDFIGLNSLLDNSIFTNGRKMRHTLTDKDDKDRKINLDNLKLWLNSIDMSVEDFLKKSSPQYLDESAILYSDFLEQLDILFDFEVEDDKETNTNPKSTPNNKQSFESNKPKSTVKYESNQNIKSNLNRNSIFFYLYEKQTDEIIKITEDNNISNYNLGQLLFGFGHSILSLEDLTQEIALLPYYTKHPDEIDVLIDYIKPERDLGNIAPLYKHKKRIYELLEQEKNKTEKNMNLINELIEISHCIIEYIYEYRQPHFINAKPWTYKGHSKNRHIQDNICFTTENDSYFIKDTHNDLKLITRETMMQIYNLNIGELNKILRSSCCSFLNIQEYKRYIAEQYYNEHKQEYDTKAAYVINDIYKPTFATEQEFNIYYSIYKEKINHPDRQPLKHIIQYGETNSCKTRTSEWVDIIYSYQVLDYSDVYSRFNNYLCYQFCCIEELPNNPKEKDQLVKALKQITKTNNVRIESKGKNTTTIKPTTLFTINTNHKTIGGIFDNEVDRRPLFERFRVIERVEVNHAYDRWLIENIRDATFKQKAALQIAQYEYIKSHDFLYSEEKTQLEIELTDKAQSQNQYLQCLDDNDIDRILVLTQSRHTRIKMRELVNRLNIRNREISDYKFNINTLRNMMIDKGICKINGSHTNLINRQLFIDTFKSIENSEDEEM